MIRSASMACSTTAASNFSSTTNIPPVTTMGRKNEEPAWDSGVQIRNRLRNGHSHSASWILVISLITRDVMITPLGVPVVPPV